jgi:peptide/nickel transport system substrate-binding protein
MKQITHTRRWLWMSLVTTALLAVQCAPAAPAPVVAPAAPAGPTAAPTQAAVPQAPTATNEATAQANQEIVNQSAAAQAKEVQKGTTVTSSEDVITPRANFGGEYHDVSTSDAVSFQPYLTTDTASSSYQGMVYASGLLRLDPNTLEYIPNMAESYTISPDGLTFTFNLRKTMKWSDGQPITAQDFQWTYDQVVKPENGFPYLSQLAFITSYKALDDYTLEIKIGEVYAPALGQMVGLISPLPKHIWEKLPWSDPQKNPEINNPSVVSGAYKLVEWKRDQYVIFEANPNYWFHGAPNITRYVTQIVPDQDIAYEKMKTGETDTAPITPDKLAEARALPNINVYEWWPAAATWSYVGLNTRQGFVTSDVNVRHGLSYAVQKQLLVDKVMLGQAKRQCSVFPETSWVYNPDVQCYEYDKDKALAAFAQAGYTLQSGKLVDKSGKQLQLKLIYGPNTSQTRELMAVSIQNDLRQIGIEVNIQAMEWSSFLQAIQATQPDWDMFIGAWQSTIEPHIMYTIWAQDSIPQLNSVGYVNKQVEQLFKEAGATYDTAVRKEKYGEIQKIIADDSPYIFLFYNKSWSGENKRVQGIVPSTLGIGWNFEDWYIKEPAK